MRVCMRPASSKMLMGITIGRPLPVLSLADVMTIQDDHCYEFMHRHGCSGLKTATVLSLLEFAVSGGCRTILKRNSDLRKFLIKVAAYGRLDGLVPIPNSKKLQHIQHPTICANYHHKAKLSFWNSDLRKFLIKVAAYGRLDGLVPIPNSSKLYSIYSTLQCAQITRSGCTSGFIRLGTPRFRSLAK